ncbi:hypothetical protein ACFPPD_00565 [Cohnella suwonensis]|uniref:Flagellar protein n=1 Tax=Cohnella suwonensis TaxID=696072 RepID=A0ABW0LNC5_9BACL
MPNELLVAHCPDCGNVFQKNIRNLCSDCAVRMDEQTQAIERYLVRNRMASNEELAAAASISTRKLRNWIRSGRLNVFHYPNLMDECDLCSSPIRKGHLCHSCAGRINDDIERTFERERVQKERLRAASSYIFRN